MRAFHSRIYITQKDTIHALLVEVFREIHTMVNGQERIKGTEYKNDRG